MSNHPHPATSARTTVARDPVNPARGQWTPARQRVFLTALLETGSVASAARAAGMSRSSAHRLRQRLCGTPFDRLWDHALALHARRMADPFADDPRIAAQPGPGRTQAAPPARG